MSATSQGSFKAGLFHPDSGNEVIEGRMIIGRWAVQFVCESLKEEIPLDRVELEVEEEDEGGQIRFSDRERPELQIFTSDRSLLKHPTFLQCNPLRNQFRAKATRGASSRAWRLTGYFLGGCLLVYWFGTLATSLAVRSLVKQVPVEWEQKFGKEQIDELRSQQKLIDEPEKVAQLAALAEPLLKTIPDLRSKPKFYIANDDEPNAYALPGGYVVVNTGLLKMVDGHQEELLAVLAHEFAHVTERHIARGLISAAGPTVILVVLFHSESGLGDLLGAGSAFMVTQGFSREYETEADDKGWQYLVRANIDPRGMINVFGKLKMYEAEELAKLKQSGDDVGVPETWSDHPALEKRIARLESRWKRLSNKTDFIELTNAFPKVETDESGAAKTQTKAIRRRKSRQ